MPNKDVIGMSPAATRRIRRVTVTAVALLALIAAVLSFEGLRTLALDAGIHPNLAWLLPLVIDGLVIVGSLGVITATLVGTAVWYFWLLTLLGVVVSIIGNIAAAPDTLLAQSVHAIPPLVFALSIEGLLAIYRASAQATTPEPPALPPETPPSPTHSTEHPPTPATTPDPAPSDSGHSTARQRLRTLLKEQPDITGTRAAETLGIDPSHARKLLREERAKQAPTST